jgi:fructose/tagatose bisphosphate aldolase
LPLPFALALKADTSSAHNASVPISVHLDHATDAEQLELAVGLAEKGIKFDSIMVDASHADVRFTLTSDFQLHKLTETGRRGKHCHRRAMD